MRSCSLYDKLWREDVLWEVWRQIKANQGAPGVDGVSIEVLEASDEVGDMINRLQRQLRGKTYRFSPVRQVDIPKPKGGTRPLGNRDCHLKSRAGYFSVCSEKGPVTGRMRLFGSPYEQFAGTKLIPPDC